MHTEICEHVLLEKMDQKFVCAAVPGSHGLCFLKTTAPNTPLCRMKMMEMGRPLLRQMTNKEGTIAVTEMTRPNWDEYFMDIAEAVAKRSNCIRPAKGAVIVKDKRIISTGYNGTPARTTNCIEGGCQRCKDVNDGKIQSGSYNYELNSQSECACCHGEENAIVHAAKHGISTDGATLYTTYSPCTWCAKMIINAGIERVVAKVDYPTALGTKLLKEAGIKLDKFGGE